MSTPLDLLVVAAHPDDAELAVGGILLLAADQGLRTGVIDLTAGERGTRGARDLHAASARRLAEAAEAATVLGLAHRECLGLPDARLVADPASRELLALRLRALRPRTLLFHDAGGAPGSPRPDPHPDHRAAGELARSAWFLAGLRRLAAPDDLGAPGEPDACRRAARCLRFPLRLAPEPDLVVDVSAVWERKLQALRCYASQLAPQDPTDEGAHILGGADILGLAELRSRHFGELIAAPRGEALLREGPLEAPLSALLPPS